MRGGKVLQGALLAAIVGGLLCFAPAAFGALTPLGHVCLQQNGVRFCPGTTATRTPSFDGTPLDADVTLPATGNGPWPTIVMLTLFGQSKTEFQTSSPEGPSPDLPEPLGLGGSILYHYNDNFFAKQGYAVVTYTPRGFFR